jgi:hypothetical protein
MRKNPRSRHTTFESLESRLALDARFVISEFMAQNNKTVDDADGDASDWIEIFNAGDATGDLKGWMLGSQGTGETEAVWTFPAVTLPPDGFLKVFASRKDRADPQAELHTNFALEKTGGTVRLLAPDFTVATQFFYPNQREDASYGFGMSEQYAVHNVMPIDPATLGPYVLLRADTGISATGGIVTQWLDQSANGFAFQANHPLVVGNGPAVIAGPSGTAALNFDGTDILDSNSDLQLFTANNSGLTVFVVLRPTSQGGQRFVVNHAPGVGGDMGETNVVTLVTTDRTSIRPSATGSAQVDITPAAINWRSGRGSTTSHPVRLSTLSRPIASSAATWRRSLSFVASLARPSGPASSNSWATSTRSDLRSRPTPWSASM